MLNLNKNQYHYIWYLSILALIMFFSFYFAIGNYPLLNNNDGLYSSIAKYMVYTKSFIIPHLNCIPYIEKPPLLYWLLSLSFSGLGFTAFAARFVTATSATLLCLSMLYCSYKIKQYKTGLLATLIFASSIGVSIIARMVYFDMLFSFFITATMLCLFYWYITQKKIALRYGYIFLALAILTKGLIAIILICGSFGLFLLLEKNLFKTLRQAIDWPGIILFLIIAIPWHIAATIQHKGFFWSYIIGEHFLRFLNLREPHDYYQGPIYYYLPRILIYLFPWSFFIPLTFLQTKHANPTEKKLVYFCWCWLLVPLVFFSLSSAKANYYMIVSMPALAIILSMKLNSWLDTGNIKLFNILVSIILFTTSGILIFIYPSFLQSYSIIAPIFIYGLLAGIIALVFTRQSQLAITLLAGLIIPVVIAATSILKLINEDISAANVGTYITENQNNYPIYIYQDFENISALAFYTNSCFKIIDTKSNDLYYGSHLAQFKPWFLTKTEFLSEIKDKPGYVVVPNKKLEQFYQDMPLIKHFTSQYFKKLTVISPHR